MATSETGLLVYYDAVYRRERHPRPRQQATIETFRGDLRLLERFANFQRAERGETLRALELGELSDELLQGAMAWQLARGRTEATANRLLRAVRAVWRHAWDAGLAPPPPRTRPLREPRREPRAWSVAEMGAIVAAAGRVEGHVGAQQAGVWWSAWAWFVYATGARRGVALALPTSAVDLDRGEVTLPAELQKQQADQTLTLRPEAVAALRRLDSAGRGLERLFGDWRGTVRTFNARWRAILVAAGLRARVEDVTRRELTHQVRRTFATHVCAASDPTTAQRLLGHAHASTTARYLDGRFLPAPNAADLVPPLPVEDDEPGPAGSPGPGTAGEPGPGTACSPGPGTARLAGLRVWRGDEWAPEGEDGPPRASA